MAVPSRPFASIWNPSAPVVCLQHQVNCTVWSDYSIWCDSHGSMIPPEQTTNFIADTDE